MLSLDFSHKGLLFLLSGLLQSIIVLSSVYKKLEERFLFKSSLGVFMPIISSEVLELKDWYFDSAIGLIFFCFKN